MNINPFLAGMLSMLFLIPGCATLTDSSEPGARATVSDKQLVQDVTIRLQNDDMTAEQIFGVIARNGIIHLYGSVKDATIRLRALGIVKGTPGVQAVVNHVNAW